MENLRYLDIQKNPALDQPRAAETLMFEADDADSYAYRVLQQAYAEDPSFQGPQAQYQAAGTEMFRAVDDDEAQTYHVLQAAQPVEFQEAFAQVEAAEANVFGAGEVDNQDWEGAHATQPEDYQGGYSRVLRFDEY